MIACGENPGLHCCRKLPELPNSTTLPLPASAAHTLPLWSTTTPTRPTKWPCGAVLPSIVARYLPPRLNFWTTLLPTSPTYTSPFDGLLELSTAMLVGTENCPAPEPTTPAWQSVLVLQTSLTAWPSLTPHPQAPLKSPFLLNFWMRAFPLSATYTRPPR